MHFTETRMQPASYFEISPNYIKHQLHNTRMEHVHIFARGPYSCRRVLSRTICHLPVFGEPVIYTTSPSTCSLLNTYWCRTFTHHARTTEHNLLHVYSIL